MAMIVVVRRWEHGHHWVNVGLIGLRAIVWVVGRSLAVSSVGHLHAFVVLLKSELAHTRLRWPCRFVFKDLSLLFKSLVLALKERHVMLLWELRLQTKLVIVRIAKVLFWEDLPFVLYAARLIDYLTNVTSLNFFTFALLWNDVLVNAFVYLTMIAQLHSTSFV